MTKTPYWEKLQDPRWQKKRLEIMERDGFTCTECDDSESQLHVHHLYYCKNREPWDYPNFALRTLCKDCHKEKSEPDEHGNFPMEEWDKGSFFENSNPWDLGVEIQMSKNEGVPCQKSVRVMVEAIRQYRSSRQ